MKRMREILEKDANDLAWTMANPHGLTNGALKDKKWSLKSEIECKAEKTSVRYFIFLENWNRGPNFGQRF